MNTPILPPLPEASNDNRKYGRAGFHSNNSPAYTAEQMNAHYLRGYNDAIAAIRTQGVPDGFALQMEASVIQAQKVLSDWNEWYGLNGGNAPLPPSGIVKAQEMLAEVRSLLAYTHPAPQQIGQGVPVAWGRWEAIGLGDEPMRLIVKECAPTAHEKRIANWFRLYTHTAPQQKLLTDEQIKLAIYKQCPDFDDWHEGPSIDDVIAIVKAAHVIGEKK